MSLYWTPQLGSYSTTSASGIPANVSVMPNPFYASWTHNSFPPVSAHVSGHTYKWRTCVNDGYCAICVTTTFTAP